MYRQNAEGWERPKRTPCTVAHTANTEWVVRYKWDIVPSCTSLKNSVVLHFNSKTSSSIFRVVLHESQLFQPIWIFLFGIGEVLASQVPDTQQTISAPLPWTVTRIDMWQEICIGRSEDGECMKINNVDSGHTFRHIFIFYIFLPIRAHWHDKHKPLLCYLCCINCFSKLWRTLADRSLLYLRQLFEKQALL